MNNAGSSWLSSQFQRISSITWGLNKEKKARDLREQIHSISGSSVLDESRIDDAQLLTLTREDLQELFPGVRNFQLRKTIMVLITDTVKDSLQTGPETFAGALKNLMHKNHSSDAAVQDVLKESLRVFREMEEQLKAAQESLKPYIDVLNSLTEARKQNWDHETPNWGKRPNSFQTDLKSPSITNTPSPPVKVYPLVCGRTLGADGQVFTMLRGVSVSDLHDCQLIFVFCPVASRAGTDTEEAVRKIPAGKPAVLVTMYHTFNGDYVCPSFNTTASQARLEEHVNLLFHDTRGGLFNCPANEHAMQKLQSVLNRYM